MKHIIVSNTGAYGVEYLRGGPVSNILKFLNILIKHGDNNPFCQYLYINGGLNQSKNIVI